MEVELSEERRGHEGYAHDSSRDVTLVEMFMGKAPMLIEL